MCLVGGVEKWEGGKLFCLIREKKGMMKNLIYINWLLYRCYIIGKKYIYLYSLNNIKFTTLSLFLVFSSLPSTHRPLFQVLSFSFLFSFFNVIIARTPSILEIVKSAIIPHNDLSANYLWFKLFFFLRKYLI